MCASLSAPKSEGVTPRKGFGAPQDQFKLGMGFRWIQDDSLQHLGPERLARFFCSQRAQVTPSIFDRRTGACFGAAEGDVVLFKKKGLFRHFELWGRSQMVGPNCKKDQKVLEQPGIIFRGDHGLWKTSDCLCRSGHVHEISQIPMF